MPKSRQLHRSPYSLFFRQYSLFYRLFWISYQTITTLLTTSLRNPSPHQSPMTYMQQLTVNTTACLACTSRPSLNLACIRDSSSFSPGAMTSSAVSAACDWPGLTGSHGTDCYPSFEPPFIYTVVIDQGTLNKFLNCHLIKLCRLKAYEFFAAHSKTSCFIYENINARYCISKVSILSKIF